MDERTRQMIEAYIPGEPDKDLEDGEYYFLQYTERGERVIRVFVKDILPHIDTGTEYGIYQIRGGRFVWVDGYGAGDRSRGVKMNQLYDNKDDCRAQTHYMFDRWEWLRRLQRDE